MTIGRIKTINSVFEAVSFLALNRLPNTGNLESPGGPSISVCKESCIRPPSTAIWPLKTFSTDSISRICVTGMALMTPASARAGLGSFTKRTMREIVGRTLRVYVVKPSWTKLALI